MTVRVVLADDSLIIRAGLSRLLEAEGCHVVAEVNDAEEVRRAVALEAPDVAIVDIRMPPTHTDEGIKAATAIRRDHPQTSVLVEGLTDQGIAERLVISHKTVATHVQHIFQRLGLPDTATDNKRVRAVLAYLRAA
jgi:DNA-binding NarL/FixJ family response regulator